MGLGLPELIVILVILLLLFGSKKLPEMARSIGESGKELRDAFDKTNSKVEETKKGINEGLSSVNTKVADINNEIHSKTSRNSGQSMDGFKK